MAETSTCCLTANIFPFSLANKKDFNHVYNDAAYEWLMKMSPFPFSLSFIYPFSGVNLALIALIDLDTENVIIVKVFLAWMVSCVYRPSSIERDTFNVESKHRRSKSITWMGNFQSSTNFFKLHQVSLKIVCIEQII